MTAEDRPAVELAPPAPLWPPLLVAGLLGLAACWLVSPIWSQAGPALIGDPETDAVRAMWGFDHLRRSLLPPETPLWSDQLNFPEGVLALILPWSSGLLAAPLGALFGPVQGYNIALMMLLWSAAMATAALVRSQGGSWSAGGAAGAAVMGQPLLLHAMADGTPEHVAIWLVPLVLALASSALSRGDLRYALLTGLGAALLCLDSPYHAIYTGLIGAFALPLSLWRGRGQEPRRALLGMTISLAAGGAAVYALFQNFPIEETDSAELLRLWQFNAADLHTWWRHQWGQPGGRDHSLAPALIPLSLLIWAGLGLLLRPAPALSWLLAAGLMVLLSFGLNPQLPAELSAWFGQRGLVLGGDIIDLNTVLYALPGLGSIRFPRRWLVPAALCLAVAGGLGYSWVEEKASHLRGGATAMAVLAVLAGVGMLSEGRQVSGLGQSFPAAPLPEPAFTAWMADQEEGAVITLPQIRPPPRSGQRADIPVFAQLSPTLAGADVLYLQVLHGQPILDYPSLKTLAPMRIDGPTYRLMRNWDDLAHPALSGDPIPESAHDARHLADRRALVGRLIEAGLRYVVLDRAAYTDEALVHIEADLQGHVASQQDFADGTGVRVYLLRR